MNDKEAQDLTAENNRLRLECEQLHDKHKLLELWRENDERLFHTNKEIAAGANAVRTENRRLREAISLCSGSCQTELAAFKD